MSRAEISNFRSISPFSLAGKRSPSKNLDLISRSFDENLLRRLKTLIPTSITLSWLSQAVDLLSATHAEAKAVIVDLRSSGSEKENGLVSYLDDSVKVLDLCNSISSEIERLRQRRLLIQFVLHLLDGDRKLIPEKLRRARNSLSDRESCPQGLAKRNRHNLPMLIRDLVSGLGEAPHGKISTVGKLVHRTIYAVGSLTVFIAGVVLAVLGGLPDIVPIRVSAGFLWADVFNGLETAVHGEIKRRFKERRLFVEDVDAVEERVRTVCEVIDGVTGGDGIVVVVGEGDKERLESAVKGLETAMESFSNGLDTLANGVNRFFDTVLCTRNGLLESFRVGPADKQSAKNAKR